MRQWLSETRNCVGLTFVLSTLVALSLTSLNGFPIPRVHDEYAYLLGADTFASGRIANPTHPMWEHFETFHVIHNPSYASKYQPAQSLTLALGQRLGHPIYGSCLATGISLAAMVWMLAGWLPNRVLWIVMVYAVFHPLFQIVWGQSYWGGGVQLTGAALLLGAYTRLTRRWRAAEVVLAAIGVVLLASSRPFEGAVLTVVVGLALGWQLLRKRGRDLLATSTLRAMLPGVAVLVAGGGLLFTYNHAVTGNPLLMPYSIHEQEYGWNPIFLWQEADTQPAYRHPVMEQFFAEDKAKTEANFSSLAGTLKIKARAALRMFNLLCGSTAVLGLCGLPWALKRRRYRVGLLLAIPAFVASLLTPWAWPHYAAPAAPLLIVLMVAGLIEIWKRLKQYLVLQAAFATILVSSHIVWWTTTAAAYTESQSSTWARNRTSVESELMREPGRHLVIVRYAKHHMLNGEWVYNAADIDDSRIVWAREMSADKQRDLIEYFHDRRAWVVDADSQPPRLTRYSEQDIQFTYRQKSPKPIHRTLP